MRQSRWRRDSEGAYSHPLFFDRKYVPYNIISRVTTAPSGKTDFVVVGRDSGPKKLEIIKKLRIKTLSEDGFLNLIATRKGILDKKQLEKQEKEEMKLKKDAAELGRREKEAKTKGCVSSFTSPTVILDWNHVAPLGSTLGLSCGLLDMLRGR